LKLIVFVAHKADEHVHHVALVLLPRHTERFAAAALVPANEKRSDSGFLVGVLRGLGRRAVGATRLSNEVLPLGPVLTREARRRPAEAGLRLQWTRLYERGRSRSPSRTFE
jgi:hypothetical protein